MSYFVYILYSSTADKYYVGQTENIDSRLLRHNSAMVPATKSFVPWKLMHVEVFETRQQSMSRETAIKKKKSRKYIEWLITTGTTRPDENRDSP